MRYEQNFYNIDYKITKSEKNKLKKTFNKINESIEKFNLPCLSIVKNNSYLKEIRDMAKKYAKFKHILICGTGGSSLGGKTLCELNKNKNLNKKIPNLHFIENVDPAPILNILNNIDLEKTAIIVISKSGETIETLCQFFFVYNYYKKKRKSLKSKLLIITENKISTLKKIHEETNCDYLIHDNKIGGRFSVFSNVALLPALLSSVNIEKIISGGKEVLEDFQNSKDLFSIKPILSAYYSFRLMRSKFKQFVLMPYSDALVNFSLWYRQLWGESIGKEGKGSTPINAIGTIDQHSQLQLYLDGPKDKFISIVGINHYCSSFSLKTNLSKQFVYSPLEKKNMESLFRAEQKATFDTIKKKKIPLRKIDVDFLDEISLGSLLMHFFLETICSCCLLNINPFDQPAVEEGKILTKKYLKDE